jgi:hypothetical protein
MRVVARLLRFGLGHSAAAGEQRGRQEGGEGEAGEQLGGLHDESPLGGGTIAADITRRIHVACQAGRAQDSRLARARRLSLTVRLTSAGLEARTGP